MVSTAEDTLDVLLPVFEDRIISRGVDVNDDRYRAMLNEFLFTKIKEKDIGNIWFQQPKLNSMFCVLFLKNALSAAELMSFGHLGAAICQR